MVDAHLGKKYILESSENFDEFMKAIGVGLITRKVANAATPVAQLTKDGDEYVIGAYTTFKNVIIRFTPGVEFEQETADGRTVKTVITIDGETIHEVQTDSSGKTITIDRTFSSTEIKMVMKADRVTATRIYKLQQ